MAEQPLTYEMAERKQSKRPHPHLDEREIVPCDVCDNPAKRICYHEPTHLDWNADMREYARSIDIEEKQKLEKEGIVEVMVLDIGNSSGWPNKKVMPSSEITHCPERQPNVPVFHIYGLTRGGLSIRLNVFGFFPFVHLCCDPLYEDEERLNSLREALDSQFEEWDDRVFKFLDNKERLTRVLSLRPIKGYLIDHYHKNPVTVLEATLASTRYPSLIGTRYEKKSGIAPMVVRTIYGDVSITAADCFDGIDQFQMETDIKGFGWVRFRHCQMTPRSSYSSRTTLEVDIPYDHFEVLEDDDAISPGLRIMTYDIEVSNETGFPTDGDSPVICVSAMVHNAEDKLLNEVLFQVGPSDKVETLDSRAKHYMFCKNGLTIRQGDTLIQGHLPHDETLGTVDEVEMAEFQMLKKIGEFVDNVDPDLIVGHNSNDFDNTYLMSRGHVCSVETAVNWGRDPCRWKPVRTFMKKRKNGEEKLKRLISFEGRIQHDTMILKEDTSMKEPSYKLNFLANKHLGESKEDVGHKLITDMWRRSNYTRRRLAVYNRKDTYLTHGLYTHFMLLFNLVELARSTRIMPQSVINKGQTARVWSLLLHAVKRPDWDAENNRALIPFQTPVEISRDDKFKGATVLDPFAGFYPDRLVMVGDFKSLYPSLIISYNIDYSTIIPNDSDEVTTDDYETSPDPVYAKFLKRERREGLLPKIVAGLLCRREIAKKEAAKAKGSGNKTLYFVMNSRQLSLKIIANSVFGFTGASGGKICCRALSGSITGWGRSAIDIASQKAKEMGSTVLTGDTDSIMFFKTEIGLDLDKGFKFLTMVCDLVTKTINRPPMELQPEKIYNPYLLYKKKHYAGMLYESPTKPPKLDVKGLETVRRDYSIFTSTTLTEVLNTLMTTKDKDKAVEVARNATKKMYQGKVYIYDLIITRCLNKKEYKTKQPHSELIAREERRDPNFKKVLGDRIPYVIVNTADGASKICSKSEDPLRVIREHIPLDYTYYMETQLQNPLTRLLSPVLAGNKTPDETMKEYVKRAEQKVKEELFSFSKLAEIPRHAAVLSEKRGIGLYFKPKRICQSCKGYIQSSDEHEQHCSTCLKNGKSKEYLEQMMREAVDIEGQIQKARMKCAICRGYYDPSIPCLQKDCRTIYDIATYEDRLEPKKNYFEKLSPPLRIVLWGQKGWALDPVFLCSFISLLPDNCVILLAGGLSRMVKEVSTKLNMLRKIATFDDRFEGIARLIVLFNIMEEKRVKEEMSLASSTTAGSPGISSPKEEIISVAKANGVFLIDEYEL